VSEHFELELARSWMLAPEVRHMAFRRRDGKPLAFVPGQFLQIHFEHQGRQLRRSYSIATHVDDAANPEQQIEIAVSYVPGGAATALLSGMREGDALQASGPYGRFVLHGEDTNRRYLLIATGTGVTPYRAMLPELRRAIPGRGFEVALVYGARTPAELLSGAEFERCAAEVPAFRYYACLSRVARVVARADDRNGRVQVALPELAPSAEHDIAYLCGNPDMVDACFTLLKDAGLPIPHIRREKYISPADPKPRVAPAAPSTPTA
jgi:ferredoxin-NADP reductase